jgi:ATP-binding cassette subfamily B (MDR/TAP) protein 1
MGNGAVLERGKHDELLSDEDGPYARLVAAQRLREAREAIDIADVVPMGQPSEKAVESSADIEKEALEETPLGRSTTHKSLASEILEHRNAQSSSKHEKEYSAFYLFRRMGRINKGEWKKYFFGCLFSIGNYFPCSDKLGVHHRFVGTGAVFPAFGIVWCTSNMSTVSPWAWS